MTPAQASIPFRGMFALAPMEGVNPLALDEVALDAFLSAASAHLGMSFADVEAAFFSTVPDSFRSGVDSPQGWTVIAEAIASSSRVLAGPLMPTLH